jgi:hypothetical protein
MSARRQWGVYSCTCKEKHKEDVVVARDEQEAEDFFRQEIECGFWCVDVDHVMDLPQHLRIHRAQWFRFDILNPKVDSLALWIQGMFVRAEYPRTSPGDPGTGTPRADVEEGS